MLALIALELFSQASTAALTLLKFYKRTFSLGSGPSCDLNTVAFYLLPFLPVWDIAHGHLVGDFSHHTCLVTSLSFSRDGGVLASASNDLSLNIWDFAKFASELNLEEVFFAIVEKT